MKYIETAVFFIKQQNRETSQRIIVSSKQVWSFTIKKTACVQARPNGTRPGCACQHDPESYFISMPGAIVHAYLIYTAGLTSIIRR